MNFLKRIKQKKETCNRLDNSLNLTLNYLQQSCVNLDKLLKNIHKLSINDNLNKESENFCSLYTKIIIVNLSDFEYNFSNYRCELEDLQSLAGCTKLHRKQNKIFKQVSEAKETQEFNFLEVYSKFLVQCQIHHTQKKQIKQKFIEVINNLNIPIHTNENEENKNND